MFMLWRRRQAETTLVGMAAKRLRFMVVCEEGLWFVHEVGSGQPVATFDAQGEAVQSARHLASITDAELLVMNADGTLASRESGALRATA
jgi:23S rRNA G2069 N7-methylase RlmK/C1962 C5-methylase RlmI